jgi:hypothetical protein
VKPLDGIANSLAAETTLKPKFFHFLEIKGRGLFIAILVDLVGIKTSVEFGSLFRSELERLLIGGDTVPQILNELDSFFSRKMC